MESVDDKIKKTRLSRRLSYIVLCASLVLVTVVTAVRALRIPGVYHALAVVQFTVICLAAWKLGASAVRAEAEERRRLAVAGGLLITPWVLWTLLPGIGAPQQATEAENELRYLVLLIDAIAIAGGLVVLREALSEAGERFYSTLGFAATMLASPLYIIWMTFPLTLGIAALHGESSGQALPWMTSLSKLSSPLLTFGVVLIYLATAAFAAALGRTGWLGRKASRAFMGASFFAVICVIVSMWVMFHFHPENSTELSKYWYAIPGSVLRIPALPWIMPLMFGVVLLRRAGEG